MIYLRNRIFKVTVQYYSYSHLKQFMERSPFIITKKNFILKVKKQSLNLILFN